MLASYIGCKIINAEPADKDGKPGYDVYYPDGYSSWSPEAVFEQAYRRISAPEREVMAMTEGESAISRISDGPEHVSEDCTHKDGRHHWEYRGASMDDYKCFHCGAVRFTKPDRLG